MRPLSKVDAVALDDLSGTAWRHANQLVLVMKALNRSMTDGQEISHAEIEAAYDLAEELRFDVAQVRKVAGSPAEETLLVRRALGHVVEDLA
ncbi:hypothetical protein [Geminicoccus flavidas]|uniref:hypothetical protein n=1 Tax=Geminicoccus flavidas TaxID=2506407 RepID=UPI00135914F4|nr:hypothetical protein [Geminicoccus flavidas]